MNGLERARTRKRPGQNGHGRRATKPAKPPTRGPQKKEWMRSPDLPRWLIWLAWGSLAATVVLLFECWPLTGGDLLIHLTVGR